MEFRKCPACEASVLDDDATECPFCGASMSGKPAAAPAKKPSPAPAAKTSAKSSPKRPPQKQVPGQTAAPKTAPKGERATKTAVAEKPKPVSDDPFDVDTSAVSQAPPVAPRPAKGRMIRVVCPMCETPGFISPKMQGRDVKCCNSECMVPVFKAPRPERKAAPEETTSGGLSPKVLWGGVGVGAVLLVFGLFFLVRNRTGPSEVDLSNIPVVGARKIEENSSPDAAADASSSTPANPAASQISLAEIQRQALMLSVRAAQERDHEGNRSKPYCRRMAAEAYAQAGDLRGARHQLERLQVVTSEPYYRVEPLVEIAWQELATGNRSAAEKTVNEALAATVDLPSFGRGPVTAAASVGAALAYFDRISDAQDVMRRVNRDDDSALNRERVAALMQIAFDLQMFDLDKLLRFSSLDMAAEPLAISVATGVAARGNWQQAIAWSLAAEEPVRQEDCLAAVAVVAGWHAALEGNDEPVSLVQRAANQLRPSGKCRVAAGIATGYLMHDDRESAASAVNEALQLLEQSSRPKAFARPSVKRIHDAADERNYGLPLDGERLRSAAIGAAQIARLQVLLDDPEAAWTTFVKAWDFTRGMAPEWEATSELANELAQNRARANQRLRRELEPANEDLARRAFSKYSRAGQYWGEAAEQRFQLEVALLRDAITWGLLDHVAAFLNDPAAMIPSAAGQPYRSTTLPKFLADAYAAAGDEAKSRSAAALASEKSVTIDRVAPLIAETERLFRAKKYSQAAQALDQFQGRHDAEQLRDLRGLQLACRLVKLKRPDEYFAFILAMKQQPALSEDCLELTAALAVREGLAPDLWNRYEAANLTSTQRVAFFRGLIAGIAAAQ